MVKLSSNNFRDDSFSSATSKESKVEYVQDTRSYFIPKLFNNITQSAGMFIQTIDRVIFSSNSNEEIIKLREQVKLLQSQLEYEKKTSNSMKQISTYTNINNTKCLQEVDSLILASSNSDSKSDIVKKGIRLLNLCDKLSLEKERMLDLNNIMIPANKTFNINNDSDSSISFNYLKRLRPVSTMALESFHPISKKTKITDENMNDSNVSNFRYSLFAIK